MKKEKLKVTYLITGLGAGGAEMMLYRLLERINLDLFQPEVIALLNSDSSIQKKIEALNINVYIIKIKSKYDLGAIYRLYKLLKSLSPDILHAQLYAADILGRIVGRLLKVPVVISGIRNVYYGGSLRNILLKWTGQLVDRTTFVSKVAKDRFIKLGITRENGAQVIYNGLNPDLFYSGLSLDDKEALRKGLGLPVDHFLFLAVGSLTKQKGYEVLFKALSLVMKDQKPFYLAVVGAGPLETRLKAIVKELRLEEIVIFIGHTDDVPKYLAAADALVLSSLWEGLPGVVLEAMASELPVVATAVGGTPELVIDRVTGYLVRPRSPVELATAMEKIMGMSAEDLAQMGQAGRKRVEEHFHVDKMIAAYENIYLECLRGKNLLKVADDEDKR